MICIFNIDLPQLPIWAKKELLALCNTIEISESRALKWKSFFPTTYNLAAQEYGTEAVSQIPDALLNELKNIYGKFFMGGANIGVAASVSINGTPSVIPPHCDRVRRTAINYLLDLGGDQVTTTFYKQQRSTNDLSLSENVIYDAVEPLESVQIPRDVWHTFDPQRFHSVENITGRRHYLSLYPIFNPSFSDFCREYHDMIRPFEDCYQVV